MVPGVEGHASKNARAVAGTTRVLWPGSANPAIAVQRGLALNGYGRAIMSGPIFGVVADDTYLSRGIAMGRTACDQAWLPAATVGRAYVRALVFVAGLASTVAFVRAVLVALE